MYIPTFDLFTLVEGYAVAHYVIVFVIALLLVFSSSVICYSQSVENQVQQDVNLQFVGDGKTKDF
jgi:hypothetical protein